MTYDSVLTLAWPSLLPSGDLKGSCCIYHYYYITDFQHLLKSVVKNGRSDYQHVESIFTLLPLCCKKGINHLRAQRILPQRAPDVSFAFQNEESSLCPPGKAGRGEDPWFSGQSTCYRRGAEKRLLWHQCLPVLHFSLGIQLCLHFTWQQQEIPVTATLYGLPSPRDLPSPGIALATHGP